MRARTRKTIQQVYECLGPRYFRRAYRMTYKAFWILRSLLQEGMLAYDAGYREAGQRHQQQPGDDDNFFDGYSRGNIRPPPTPPNGGIPLSTRLGCALRYFAGASPYDLMSGQQWDGHQGSMMNLQQISLYR
jgi:hypothetical protein